MDICPSLLSRGLLRIINKDYILDGKNIMKKIVVIGGGTGTFTVLSGLKKYPQIDLSAIVSMADSGGSNRVLRDDFGLLPTSDLRQCLVALSEANGDGQLWRELFSYRYSKGVGISGMTFGNLFMAALADILGSQEKAIEKTAEILKVKGQVIPVTFEDVDLLASYEEGKQVVGEHFIDEPKKGHNGKLKISNLSTIPQARANSLAIKAILEADLIILGPGDLYTSILANIVIKGISQAIVKSSAQKIYIMNLMTKWGQTYKLGAFGHSVEIEKYLKAENKKINPKPIIDYILINNGNIEEEILSKYKKEKAEQVVDDLTLETKSKIIRADFVAQTIYKKSAEDVLKRSLIRHDQDKLAKVIIKILNN